MLRPSDAVSIGNGNFHVFTEVVAVAGNFIF
jgi:hypothetical protein